MYKRQVRTSFLWKKQVWGIDDRAYAENLGFLKELLDLEEIWTVFARELSLGQRMRANLALTFLHDPQPVSYTHLDVYKRQISCIFWTN